MGGCLLSVGTAIFIQQPPVGIVGTLVVDNIGGCNVPTYLPANYFGPGASILHTIYINNAVTVITADTHGTNFGTVLRTVWSIQ